MPALEKGTPEEGQREAVVELAAAQMVAPAAVD